MDGLYKELDKLFEKDPASCKRLIESLLEDELDYTLSVMVECTDQSVRHQTCRFLSKALRHLMIEERAILYDTVDLEVEVAEEVKQESNEAGIQEESKEPEVTIVKTVKKIPVAVTTKFMQICFDNLNGRVAKNSIKFEQFMNFLWNFCEPQEGEFGHLGLEFFFRNKFVEKAADLILGRKSPLYKQ